MKLRSIALYSNQEKELIFASAEFGQLIYISSMWFEEEAIPYLWQQLKFTIRKKDALMRALG